MNDEQPELAHLLEAFNLELTQLNAIRIDAANQIGKFDRALKAVKYHPNYPAYVHGGILADKRFGSEHVLAYIGFAALPWSLAVARIACATNSSSDSNCIIDAIRLICEQDASLESAGLAWCGDRRLLQNCKAPAIWFQRPKLGLGQPAKAYGFKPEDAPGHRGIYEIGIDAMTEAFAHASEGMLELGFGALLPVVITQGGQRLQEIGAAALHADAEARYWERKHSFASRQAATSNRQWRGKPPTSRQGHLAVTTAQKLGIQVPAERNRGDAADWLEAHNANLRFWGTKND